MSRAARSQLDRQLPRWRWISAFVGTCLFLAMLAGCSSPELAPTPMPSPTFATTSIAAAVTITSTQSARTEPCSSGTLIIGDLPAIDRAWQDGISQAAEKGTEWQQDAVLSNLRVVCQLFETEFRWQATFYSRNAQAFFSSDTREVVPASISASDVPELDLSQLSFALLHDSLNEAGYGDEIEISPSSGVDIRVNTAASRFGPPQAPLDVILYHVAIERLGEVKDIFVDGRDGTIYLYEA